MKPVKDALAIFNLFQFIKYSIFGGVGSLIDLFSFYLLNSYFDEVVIANIMSTLIGIITSYILNSRFTFHAFALKSMQIFRFFFVGIFGLIISTLLLIILNNFFIQSALFSKLVILPLIAILQFTVNRKWTFSDKNS